MKKTILYIIDSLGGIGGAEIMLVNQQNNLKLEGFKNIDLIDVNIEFVAENRNDDSKPYYCFGSWETYLERKKERDAESGKNDASQKFKHRRITQTK